MKIILSPQKFCEIIKKGYSLDVVFMLSMLNEQIGLDTESAKITALQQMLNRKGLITEDGCKLTTIGEDLLKYIHIEKEESDLTDNEFVPFIKKKSISEDFEKWWMEFPSSDYLEYKGKVFKGNGRGLRIKHDDCRLKFDKFISEGKYTAEEMIEALKLEVYRKMEASIIEGKNNLTYMKASLSYLNQDNLPFVDDIRKGVKIIEQENITYYGVNG